MEHRNLPLLVLEHGLQPRAARLGRLLLRNTIAQVVQPHGLEHFRVTRLHALLHIVPRVSGEVANILIMLFTCSSFAKLGCLAFILYELLQMNPDLVLLPTQ